MILEDIKKLREETACSVGECKKALEEAGGDFEKAKRILSLSAAKTATKKASRETREGVIATYLHSNKKIGAMVEVLCETDFVAKNPAFSELAHAVAMHIAGMAPLYVSIDDVPEDVRTAIQTEAAGEVEKMNKPDAIVKQIIDGKVRAYFSAQSLLSQPYVKDQDTTIEELIQKHIGKFGENIKVRRFVRYEL